MWVGQERLVWMVRRGEEFDRRQTRAAFYHPTRPAAWQGETLDPTLRQRAKPSQKAADGCKRDSLRPRFFPGRGHPNYYVHNSDYKTRWASIRDCFEMDVAQHLRLPARPFCLRMIRCDEADDCAKYTIDGTRPTLEVSRELWLEWVQGAARDHPTAPNCRTASWGRYALRDDGAALAFAERGMGRFENTNFFFTTATTPQVVLPPAPCVPDPSA